jgi:hypothetical protein
MSAVNVYYSWGMFNHNIWSSFQPHFDPSTFSLERWVYVPSRFSQMSMSWQVINDPGAVCRESIQEIIIMLCIETVLFFPCVTGLSRSAFRPVRSALFTPSFVISLSFRVLKKICVHFLKGKHCKRQFGTADDAANFSTNHTNKRSHHHLPHRIKMLNDHRKLSRAKE